LKLSIHHNKPSFTNQQHTNHKVQKVQKVQNFVPTVGTKESNYFLFVFDFSSSHGWNCTRSHAQGHSRRSRHGDGSCRWLRHGTRYPVPVQGIRGCFGFFKL